jgi:hypothetical protein
VGMVLEPEEIYFRNKLGQIMFVQRWLRYSTESIISLRLLQCFSNYIAANMVVTASRLMLVQLLHRHYVALYSENSLFTDIKFKCNIPTSACHQYGYRIWSHMFSGMSMDLRVEQNLYNQSCWHRNTCN